MRTKCFILSLFAVVLCAACNEEKQDGPEKPVALDEVSCFLEDLKNPATGAEAGVSWSESASIAVWGGDSFAKYDIESGNGTTSAKFSSTNPVEPSGIAVFPYSSELVYSANKLTLSLPSNISEGTFTTPMVAFVGAEASNLVFRQIGAAIRVTAINIPENAAKLIVSSKGNRISGTYEIDATDKATTALELAPAENAADSIIAVSFAGKSAEKTFEIALPCGTYETITLSLENATGEAVGSSRTFGNVVIAKKDYVDLGNADLAEVEIADPKDISFYETPAVIEIPRWNYDSDFACLSEENIDGQTTCVITLNVKTDGKYEGVNKMSYSISNDGANFSMVPAGSYSVQASAEAFDAETTTITYRILINWSFFKDSYYYSLVFKLLSLGNCPIVGNDTIKINIFTTSNILGAGSITYVDGSCNSRRNSGCQPDKIVDGQTDGAWDHYWMSAFNNTSCTGSLTLPYKADFEFNESRLVRGFKFYVPNKASGCQQDTKAGYVELSADGTTWTKACEFDLSNRLRYINETVGPFYMTCPPTEAKFFRMVITESNRIDDNGIPRAAMGEMSPMI